MSMVVGCCVSDLSPGFRGRDRTANEMVGHVTANVVDVTDHRHQLPTHTKSAKITRRCLCKSATGGYSNYKISNSMASTTKAEADAN